MTTELDLWEQQLNTGNARVAAAAAEKLAAVRTDVDTEFVVTVFDNLWRSMGAAGGFIELSGAIIRNKVPSGTLKLMGSDPHVGHLMGCRKTLVGVTVETGGLRFPFYVDTHDYEFADNAWTSTANLKGIHDILSYLIIWPDFLMPIWAQVISHAIFIGPIVTCIENMISECLIRIQAGINEFLNNAGSLNPDVRAWFGTLLLSNGNVFEMLKTPGYVVRTNPAADASPWIAKTVRMQSCQTVIEEITKPYGVIVEVSLWLPGDPQPDPWAFLDQPTYVFTVKDRQQLQGQLGGPLDGILKTVVDIEGSLLGNALDPILNPKGEFVPEGQFAAPALGLHYVTPWAMLIAPEPEYGEVGNIVSCKITDHTPKAWQHVLGGRSPKWLNDLTNAFWSWLIDAAMIAVGFIGIPSTILDGFLNNSFLSFQLIEHYVRRAEMGPYHPCIEQFTATGSSPYNVETLFTFIKLLWDSRGYTSAQVVFRNGQGITLGRDGIFLGSAAGLAYLRRTKLLVDYIEAIMFRCTKTERDVFAQIGDGQAEEAPLAHLQRSLTGLQEAFNVATLAPQS